MDPIKPEDVLKYCLENPDNLSLEQMLARFPEQRDEIQAMLSLDSRLKSSLSQQLPDKSRQAIKAQMLAAAASKGAVQAEPAKKPVLQRTPILRPWARGAVWALGAAAALVLLVWGLSANALADSPFYNVKLTAENELIQFAGDVQAQAKGHIELATARLYDLRAMQSQGKLGQAQSAFSNYRDHFKSGVDVWHGSNGANHASLSKLLYVSSVIGQRTFEGFSDVVAQLPEPVKNIIGEIVPDIDSLNTATEQELTADGVDLDELLHDADSQVTSLLTPLPGVALATLTPTSAPTLGPTSIPPTPTTVPCLDIYESDGLPDQARNISVGETQRHTLCPAGDADWLRFYANAGKGYSIVTSELSPGVNTYLYLFGTDAKTLIASTGDAPDALSSSPIIFYPPADGQYFFQVKNHGGVGTGDTSYSVSVLPVDATATPTALVVESP